MRDKILELIQSINPFDEIERRHIQDTTKWIQNGADLFRVKKPDVPPKHLVSYFVLVDAEKEKLLLVDHIKAQLWLPAGGHVEQNEDPQETVKREILEELGVEAKFMYDKPFFLTQAVTVGLTAGHTDVSFWYVLKGNSELSLHYDPGEFNGYKWFTYSEVLEIPIKRLDPHLHRFMNKWIAFHN